MNAASSEVEGHMSVLVDNTQRQLDELDAIACIYGHEVVEDNNPEARVLLASWVDAAIASHASSVTIPMAPRPVCELDVTVWLGDAPRVPADRYFGCRLRMPPGYPDAHALAATVAIGPACVQTGDVTRAVESALNVALERAVGDVFDSGCECAHEVLLAADQLLRTERDRIRNERIPSGGSEKEKDDEGQQMESNTREMTAQGGEKQEGNVGVDQDADRSFSSNGVSQSATTATASHRVDPDTAVGRRLVWSHHIKSTTKKKQIVSWADELGLSGYCKPGYPGIILVEGCERDVAEYMQRLRRLTWKALVVKGEEVHPAGTADAERRLPVGAGVEMMDEGDMARLGQLCKEVGLHDLFMTQMH
eukprot:m.50125 g.50125  ORF g.50125 m.50125 type:complete len:364 (+) comp7207_c0_seq1:195-1286(+)